MASCFVGMLLGWELWFGMFDFVFGVGLLWVWVGCLFCFACSVTIVYVAYGTWLNIDLLTWFVGGLFCGWYDADFGLTGMFGFCEVCFVGFSFDYCCVGLIGCWFCLLWFVVGFCGNFVSWLMLFVCCITWLVLRIWFGLVLNCLFNDLLFCI